ncbi:MAG: DUF2851 family protein [Chloroflexi bacterium]|nr:DUF2851 family protein [Chloroflexota bacterium]
MTIASQGSAHRSATTGPLSEKAVSALWQRTPSLTDGLVTEDGRRFRVIYAGRPNARAGPDFRDARLATESGAQITGDVELHVKAPDWYGHGHHSDPGYNGVVLHVVLLPKGRTDSGQQSRMRAPIASIAPVVPLLEAADRASPSHSLQRPDEEAIAQALDRAGYQRFVARSEGLRLELQRSSPDEVAHGALMEALGYASNRRPFRLLAARVPFGLAIRLRDEPEATRLLALQSLLVGSAGLLSYVTPYGEAETMRRLYRTVLRNVGHLAGNEAWRRRPMRASEWHTFRVRPANHPLRRIIGAAYLMDRYAQSGLARGLQEDVRRLKGRGLRARMEVSPFVGAGRAGDIVVNAVLPLVHALASEAMDWELVRRSLEVYDTYPRLEANEVTREMERLLGRTRDSKIVTGARRQQGLVHLYRHGKPGAGSLFEATGDSST